MDKIFDVSLQMKDHEGGRYAPLGSATEENWKIRAGASSMLEDHTT